MRRIYILVLFLILVEMFSVFLPLGGCKLWHSFTLPLLYLDMSTVSLLSPGLLSWMDIGFCQKAFSITNEMILCFVSSCLFTWWIVFIDLHILSHNRTYHMKLLDHDGQSFLYVLAMVFKYFMQLFHLISPNMLP